MTTPHTASDISVNGRSSRKEEDRSTPETFMSCSNGVHPISVSLVSGLKDEATPGISKSCFIMV